MKKEKVSGKRVDVPKRAGQVQSIGFVGQSSRESKQVIVKWVNWVAGRGTGRVDPYFSSNFFLEIDAICQLFMSSLTVI